MWKASISLLTTKPKPLCQFHGVRSVAFALGIVFKSLLRPTYKLRKESLEEYRSVYRKVMSLEAYSI
jgi:hypothetical protein